MNNFPCCALCRGVSPYFFCKDKRKSVLQPGCDCHVEQEKRAVKYQTHLGHRDHTANTAINNVMRGKK